jgi:hypothetical protein
MAIDSLEESAQIRSPINLVQTFGLSAINASFSSANTLGTVDPNIANDPVRFAQLTNDQQLAIGIMQEKNGIVPEGDPDRLQEARLAAAGYAVSYDGELSGQELAELDDLKNKQSDQGLFKAGAAVFSVMAGEAVLDNTSPIKIEMGVRGNLAGMFAGPASGQDIPQPAAPVSDADIAPVQTAPGILTTKSFTSNFTG